MSQDESNGIRVVSSANDGEIQRHKLLLEAERDGRELATNLLRILRGHGEPEALTNNARDFASSLEALANFDPTLIEELRARLSATALPDFPTDGASAEQSHRIREALQVVASRFQNDLWRAKKALRGV